MGVVKTFAWWCCTCKCHYDPTIDKSHTACPSSFVHLKIH